MVDVTPDPVEMTLATVSPSVAFGGTIAKKLAAASMTTETVDPEVQYGSTGVTPSASADMTLATSGPLVIAGLIDSPSQQNTENRYYGGATRTAASNPTLHPEVARVWRLEPGVGTQATLPNAALLRLTRIGYGHLYVVNVSGGTVALKDGLGITWGSILDGGSAIVSLVHKTLAPQGAWIVQAVSYH